MISKVEFEKRGETFVVRSHHLTPRRVKVPIFSGGVATGKTVETTQNLGEWKEEFFADEATAKRRYQVVAGSVTNV